MGILQSAYSFVVSTDVELGKPVAIPSPIPCTIRNYSPSYRVNTDAIGQEGQFSCDARCDNTYVSKVNTVLWQ